MTLISTSMARDQVLSWLHDEESMVTAQKIQQECFGEYTHNYGNADAEDNSNDNDNDNETKLSRRKGSELLRDLYEGDPNKYAATVVVCSESSFESNGIHNHCNNKDNNGGSDKPNFVTTFSCRGLSSGDSIQINDGNDQKNENNPATMVHILSLSKATTSLAETLDSCHERDMGSLRDKEASWFAKQRELSHILVSPYLNFVEAAPGAGIAAKTWHKFERDGLIVRPKAVATTIAAATTTATATATATSTAKKNTNTTTNSKSRAGTKKVVKPTTARSFFSKKPTTSVVVAVPPKIATKTAATSKQQQQRAAVSRLVHPKQAETEEEDNTITNNDDGVVGTADDFVGDEDEDSDDEQDMVERREKSKEIARKQKQQDDLLDALHTEEDKEDRNEDDKPTPVRGAMDAFAIKSVSKQTAAAVGSDADAGKHARNKRRKVLKETTTVNAQGFLVTTTASVWEDVPSSDSDKPPPPNQQPKPTASKSGLMAAGGQQQQQRSTTRKLLPSKGSLPKKKASDMKQGSLMGFFSVKKPN